jgi:hypothetical protein
MPKIWCRHIAWDYDNNDPNRYYWQLNDGTNDIIPVPRNWKVCPVCGAERPTRANKKAAELRFLMDNDQ